MLRIRKATIDDLNILFDWVNEKTTRLYSLQSKDILFSEHKEWFTNALTDYNCFIYIFCHGTLNIGQVRFNLQDSNYMIDYSLDKKFRGKGYGKTMLSMAMQEIKKMNIANIVSFKAIVKTDNEPSLKIFTQLGFIVTEETNDCKSFNKFI